jgi:hypothetical protein
LSPTYDLSFTQAERDSLLRGLEDYQKAFQAIHQFKLANSTEHVIWFSIQSLRVCRLETVQKPIDWGVA